MVPDILHGFAKDAVVHQLEKVFLKVVLSRHSKHRVLHDIRLQPGALLKFDYSVHLFQHQAMLQSLIELFDMYNILSLVA